MIDLIDWTPRLYPSLTILEGRFVRLEPLNKTKHAEGVCQMCLSEDAHERFRYFGSYPPKSEEEELAWLKKAEKKKLIYVIIDKIREDVVGTIEFYNPVLENGTIEIFVYFSKMIAKKSGATEALYLIGSFIFDELKYRRLEWCTDNRNEASKNAATRFGFVYETLHPQNRINKKEIIDIACFSIIDKDWSIIKKSCEKWLENQNFDENGNQKERLSEIRRKIEISSNFFIQAIDPPPPVLSSQESDINAKAFDLVNWTDRNLPSHTIMEGKYVRLEPLSIEKHGDALFEIVSQEKQRLDYLPECPPKDRDQFQQWLIMAESSQDPLYFTIIDKATGKVAGRQALSRIRPNHGVIEMGHVLWSSLIARKPAATEACYLLAKHVFDTITVSNGNVTHEIKLQKILLCVSDSSTKGVFVNFE
uniref:N-acetyltransferase domain-containing protein n=1 Tax=Acrobeloides nanus TaxID=290746 RepID=A0A914DW52_9BILA